MGKWFPSESEAVKLLEDENVPDSVVVHTKAVATFAVELAEKVKAKGHIVDIELVKIGALLHDIGRSVTHGIAHGVEGRKILERHNVDVRLCRIACNHVLAGIDAVEAGKLGLPAEDMVPETVEEKLICYADKLAFGSRIGEEEEVLERFETSFGKNHPLVVRMRKFFEGIKELV